MLGGVKLTETTRKHAAEMLQRNKWEIVGNGTSRNGIRFRHVLKYGSG